jgi:DNA-binding response OmpR family regulator
MRIVKILYVEDDENLALITRHHLEKSSYHVTHCSDGTDAWDTFTKDSFDLCILDIMLPGTSGFTLASKIRDFNSEIPIIFLTAKSLLEDKILGLQTGADDYLTKPFSYQELDLKIKVFLKRTSVKNVEPSLIRIGSYTFDADNLKLVDQHEEHKLTLKEAELLHFLFKGRNKVLKRDDILMAVWGNDDYFLGRSLDVFISRIRKYLSKDINIKIENVHSVGFRMNVKE